jgi:tetraacyldisaccharide 4'-kinase
VTTAAALLTRVWYAPRPTPVAQLLRPLSWMFGALARVRRAAYRTGLLRPVRLPVPVVVVGNITVGGVGKTPLVVALVEALRDRGRHPGIVSRGYGRRTSDTRPVHGVDDAADVGDEPLILVTTGVPVWVGSDRAGAAAALLAANPDVDVIVADDGLQHYALARDVEIAVVDTDRNLGNRLLLPAGPLREPASRLATVDAIVRLGSGRMVSDVRGAPREFAMVHAAQPWRNLADSTLRFRADTLHDAATVAIAGIGNPQRFFDALRACGFAGSIHAFPDHHSFTREELAFPQARAVLMTEKDAVKCRAFADARMWMLPIQARVDSSLIDLVAEKLDGSEVARDAGVSGHQGAARP